jgi:hypothetical protein
MRAEPDIGRDQRSGEECWCRLSVLSHPKINPPPLLLWLTLNPDIIVDFETFSKILNRPGGFREPGEPEEYCRGFQVFDKDMTGFIGVGQLRYILTNLGEKMSDEEVDELLKAVDTGNGEVNYTGEPTPSAALEFWGWEAIRLDCELMRKYRSRTHDPRKLDLTSPYYKSKRTNEQLNGESWIRKGRTFNCRT